MIGLSQIDGEPGGTPSGTGPLLAALWQSDSAFPNGAFAFSNGVEGAAALDPPLDAAKLEALLTATLVHRWCGMDRVALLHAFHAADSDRLVAVDARVEAATLAEPLRAGSRRNGVAFLTAHGRLGTPGAATFRAEIAAGRAVGHLGVAQGWVWRRCGLDARSALAASAYGCASAMVAAAVRLGAVGALAGQGVLSRALPLIADLVARPFDPEADILLSSLTPWLDIASIRHARSGMRLFSN